MSTHHHIDFVELPVTDIAAAKAFYARAFGWTFVDYGPDYADIRGAGLSGGKRFQFLDPSGNELVVWTKAE